MSEYKTRAKEYIIEFLESNKEKRFSAKDVYDYIVLSGGNINLATVYRNIDSLEKKGMLIKSKDCDSDSATYKFVGKKEECHHHLHIECKSCGKMVHLEGDEFKKFSDYILNNLSFTLEYTQSHLVGYCKDCRKAIGLGI